MYILWYLVIEQNFEHMINNEPNIALLTAQSNIDNRHDVELMERITSLRLSPCVVSLASCLVSKRYKAIMSTRL